MINLLVPPGLFVLAFALALRAKEPFAEALYRRLLLFSVGIQGLWAGLAHRFASEFVAAHIGWATSPFQHEIGFANLGFGVAGVLAYVWPSFRNGAAVGISIFMMGAASVHVQDMLARGNFAFGNAGPIFYTDIFIPIALVACMIALAKRDASEREPAGVVRG